MNKIKFRYLPKVSKMGQIKKIKIRYRVVCQWWIIRKPAGNLRKLAAEVSGRFPAGFRQVSGRFSVNRQNQVIPALFELYMVKSTGITSDFFYLLETCRRFLDDPSLTDHTVCISWTRENIGVQKSECSFKSDLTSLCSLSVFLHNLPRPETY